MKYPLAPLLAYYGEVWCIDARSRSDHWVFTLGAMYPNGEKTALAELCGVSRETVARWGRDGMVERAADRAAIALGVHPSLIWPEWFSEYQWEEAC